MPTQADKINVELKKKIMTNRRLNYYPFETRVKKVKVEIERTSKLLTTIPMGNISELNKLIYTGGKLGGDKIGVPQRNSKINSKPG